jgi:hypothetical protein
VQAGLEVLLEDLPMQSLRDLAQKLDASGGKYGVMRVLRKTAAVEYVESDVPLLGILSELFGWAKKGEFYKGQAAGAVLD